MSVEAMKMALEALGKWSSGKDMDAVALNDLIATLEAALAHEEQEPVAWALSPTDIYDFAGWLTTRPGTLMVGSKHEAGPMAEAVGEYLQTFPDRFVALPQREPLTDEEIWSLYYDQDHPDGERSDRVDFARAIERAHGIGGRR